MTTKPTPASQPYPEFCTGCWKRVEECKCASAEQPSPAQIADAITRFNSPSPARSDKDAAPDVRALLKRAEQALDMAHSYVNDGGGDVDEVEDASIAIAEFLQAERAPSGEHGNTDHVGRDMDGIAQPLAGAIVLLETIAECGATAFIDGQRTPNSELCKRFADELRTEARRATAGQTFDAAWEAADESKQIEQRGIARYWFEQGRATAGTTAAPTCSGCDPAEGFCKVCREAERATAGNAAPTEADENAPWLTLAHIICANAGIEPGHITDRLKTLRDLLEAALRGNTATAAPGDLPKLPKCKMLVGAHLDSLHVLYSEGQVREIQREAYEAGRASNAGAAPGEETHDDRCRLIRDFGDTKLIADVQAGRISIHAAVEKVRRAAPSTSPVGAAQEKEL